MNPIDAGMRRILWYVFTATRGGVTRIRIMDLLMQRPYNANQLSTELSMDYKTVQHHIKILETNKLIVSEDKKYGTMYFPSQMFEQSDGTYNEIKSKMVK